MKYEKYDAILHVIPELNESVSASGDDRIHARRIPGINKGFTQYMDADDPKMYSSFSFGNIVRQTLNNMGNGFSAKVTDFKKWVVVEIAHHNTITGKSASKTFLVVFKHKGDGMVLTTHNKYRSISGVDQALSYIKSAASILQNDTQNRI
jgi:hypothetical protein